MKIIYDLFDVPMPLVAPEEKRSSKQKKKIFSGTMNIEKKKFNF